jgi:lipoprotein-anchoring transpeptidase ErfK/SrfK
VKISRRDFLKIGALGAGLSVAPQVRGLARLQGAVDQLDLWKQQYANGTRLGRLLATLTLRTHPDADAPSISKLYPDALVEILREVVGRGPSADPHNHRWFETPDGYLWAPYVFPMDFQIQEPTDTIPDGKVWAEVSVPWLVGHTEPSESSPAALLQPGNREATLYYASIYPVTKTVKDDAGRTWYFLDELALPMYARAEGLRLITAEEVAPISPEVENKLIVVDLTRPTKTLAALENGKEVFFTYISCGGINKEEHKSATPPGDHPIWRKRIGLRMGGGDIDTGYDLPGVGWACIFTGHGEAIHSTYWHNDFGIPKSHGCVNTRPQDAQWLFRWTSPVVDYPSGDRTIQGKGGTIVRVLF